MGSAMQIKREEHSDSKVRYRQRLSPEAPGIFIPREEACQYLKEDLLQESMASSINYDQNVIATLVDTALDGNMPTYEEAVEIWQENLVFDYNILFTDKEFADNERIEQSLYMFWLSSRFIGQSKEEGVSAQDIVDKTKDLFERTAAQRIKYNQCEVASISVIAANADRLVNDYYEGRLR